MNRRGTATHVDLHSGVFDGDYWFDHGHMDYAFTHLLSGGGECYEFRGATVLPVGHGKDITVHSCLASEDDMRNAAAKPIDPKKPICVVEEEPEPVVPTNSGTAPSSAKPPSVEKDSLERIAGHRRALNIAFRTQHGHTKCEKGDCVAPFLLGEDTHVLTCVFNKPNHWVAVAMCNVNVFRAKVKCAESTRRCSVVIMDSLFKREMDRPPGYHSDIGCSAKHFLHNVFSYSKPCDKCRTAFGLNGEAADVCDSVFNVENIEILSPRVPEQHDTNQCGAMSVLSVWTFLRNAKFAEYCLSTPPGVPSEESTRMAHPYSHEDAFSLREYLKFHWELDRELQTTKSTGKGQM